MLSLNRKLTLLVCGTCLLVGQGFVVVPTPGGAAVTARTVFVSSTTTTTTTTRVQSSAQPTELPDSLQDAAERAAKATTQYVQQAGPMARCRVDFDTSVGDETFSLLKTSTEFMQDFVSACCNAMIPGLQEMRQAEMMRVVQARAEIKAMQEEKEDQELDKEKVAELQKVIALGGREEGFQWKGPVCRVYFPVLYVLVLVPNTSNNKQS